MNNKSRYIVAILLVVITIILSVYAYEFTQREAPQAKITEFIYGDDGLPTNYWDLSIDNIDTLIEMQTEPEMKAIYQLRKAELIKRNDPNNIESIIAALKVIYDDVEQNSQERALALFKISQQANGFNRFDLLEPFLEVDTQGLTAGQKNYLMNQKIYQTHPMGIVYMDIKLHEIIRGDEYDPALISYLTKESLQKDVDTYIDKPQLADLIPDLYMHAAVLLSHIDPISIPESNFTSEEEILFLLEQGEAYCDRSSYISKKCTTRDFIKIARIDYLLKINRVEEAKLEVQKFLDSDLRPMIRSYIVNDKGLENGRYKYIEQYPDIVNTLVTTIPTLPDPS